MQLHSLFIKMFVSLSIFCCIDAVWEKLFFFLFNWSLFNHTVKLHVHWTNLEQTLNLWTIGSCIAIKSNQWLAQCRCVGVFRARWLTPPSCHRTLHCSARPRTDEELVRVMTTAVSELRFAWSLPEEPSRSRLDEWFLPERQQAPRQRSSSFFPEVPEKLTKSWHAPYSSHICPFASSALTSFDGAEEKGYVHLPPLDESVAAHLCPLMAIGWKGWANHPSVQAMQSHLCTRWMHLLSGLIEQPVWGQLWRALWSGLWRLRCRLKHATLPPEMCQFFCCF